MSPMIQNVSGTTQVFCLGNGRVLSMQSRVFGGTPEYVTDDEFSHPNVRLLIEKGVLAEISEERAAQVAEEVKEEKAASEEHMAFEKAVESAMDVKTIRVEDGNIMAAEVEERIPEEPAEAKPECDVIPNEPEYIEYQCSAHTNSGSRCKRKVRLTKAEYEACNGEVLCGVHAK